MQPRSLDGGTLAPVVVTASDVRGLRARLALARPSFARLIGVDLRTVIRWETGAVSPSGPGAAVLTAFLTTLDRTQNADAVIALLVKAAEIGGLAYLLMTLLERATAARR